MRLELLVPGRGLTATATAVAGPMSFVALAAADFLAQRAFAPTRLPVGAVTVSIGGFISSGC